ncbi:hypothetical protein GC722_03675 [Auraticoccus sp. F435]|uniref:Uncharacterized protein n=1 Tax=Auraticoccus cholistanensis TaxID=2656650 RepID=A0A6A9UR43_9ACTN|nr:hypothetical protein [Auraticoccus cholistanensis]MVA75131.1 hypothetical protein [Auraticoccus cholistanensis]
MSRTWPDWALALHTWVVGAVVLGTVWGLGSASVVAGVVGGVVFGTFGGVGVVVLLRSLRSEPVRGERVRAALPLAVLVGTLAGGAVMALLLWLALRG